MEVVALLPEFIFKLKLLFPFELDFFIPKVVNIKSINPVDPFIFDNFLNNSLPSKPNKNGGEYN